MTISCEISESILGITLIGLTISIMILIGVYWGERLPVPRRQSKWNIQHFDFYVGLMVGIFTNIFITSLYRSMDGKATFFDGVIFTSGSFVLLMVLLFLICDIIRRKQNEQ